MQSALKIKIYYLIIYYLQTRFYFFDARYASYAWKRRPWLEDVEGWSVRKSLVWLTVAAARIRNRFANLRTVPDVMLYSRIEQSTSSIRTS